MRKSIFTLILLSVSLVSFATDWSSIAWLADGAGDGAYANKYKVAAAFGQTVVNIQKPEFAAEAGIYTNFPAGIESCTLPAGGYVTAGAGMVLYLSAFTQKETSVTVVAGSVSYDFKVYYEDGEGEMPGDDPEPGDDPQPGDLTPATFHGQSTVQVSGADCLFTWSITRNANSTLTFKISWQADIVGAVPQLCLDGTFINMPSEGKLALFTTTDTYEDGATLNNTFFYIAYSGGAANVPITGYTVGASNEPDPMAVDHVGAQTKAHKIIENGQVIVLKNGRRFNLLGTEIK